MARTIAEIKAQMIAEKNAQSALSGLTSTSQTALWNLYIYLVATAVNIFEQILDLFKVDIETIAYNGYAGSAQWTQKKVFEFQYSATTPQYVVYNPLTSVIAYPVVDATLQIITRCSVARYLNKVVVVKAAKGTTPTALTNTEKTALQGYLYDIGFAGIDYVVISNPPDMLSVIGDVYYQGAYSATIVNDVTTALNNYLANIPFDGYVTTTGVIDAVLAVQGVVDFGLSEIGARKDGVGYASRTFLYNLGDGTNLVKYQTDAGYIVEDTTFPFSTTLSFNAQ